MTINIDGASRGNPGPSGVGIVLSNDDLKITEHNEYIGHKTNNQAEYAALKKALQIASGYDEELTVLSDSELVVNQRNNKYKVRNKGLKIICREISNLEKNFKTITYKYVPRERNVRADFLANQAIVQNNNNKY